MPTRRIELFAVKAVARTGGTWGVHGGCAADETIPAGRRFHIGPGEVQDRAVRRLAGIGGNRTFERPLLPELPMRTIRAVVLAFLVVVPATGAAQGVPGLPLHLTGNGPATITVPAEFYWAIDAVHSSPAPTEYQIVDSNGQPYPGSILPPGAQIRITAPGAYNLIGMQMHTATAAARRGWVPWALDVSAGATQYTVPPDQVLRIEYSSGPLTVTVTPAPGAAALGRAQYVVPRGPIVIYAPERARVTVTCPRCAAGTALSGRLMY